jgi:hypothetical protein
MKKMNLFEMKEIRGGAPAEVVECVEAFIDSGGMTVEKAMNECYRIFNT